MGDLRARIAERIRRDGPISFADFMDMALYDPEDGFYTHPPVGQHGHFVTSPHVSAAFGDLISRQLNGCFQRMGEPSTFQIIEAGAGDGTLARQVLKSLTFPYAAVERSPGAREALNGGGIANYSSLNDLKPVTGCVIANELLDNLPFRRLRGANEVMVGLDGDRLVEIEQPAGERTASPATLVFVREAVGVIERGYVIIYDYAVSEVRAYEKHRLHDRLLDSPGAADITAGVDFDAVAAEAKANGARVWGPRSQRVVLMDLGFRAWMDELRERRLKERDPREMLQLIAEQSKAPLLVDEAHLGSFKVIAFGVNVDEPPPGFDVG